MFMSNIYSNTCLYVIDNMYICPRKQKNRIICVEL